MKGFVARKHAHKQQQTFTFIYPVQQFAATHPECSIETAEHLLPADDVIFFMDG